VTKPISFEEFVAKKRQRPEQICFTCGKLKEIYTHLNGEEDKPLCNACNMKLRRESPGAIQVKLGKLGMAAIGSVEAMLGLPVEEKQKKTLQDMQDELKVMVRVWLGDPHADEEADATPDTATNTTQTADPAGDEFAEARKIAVSEASDQSFEAPKSAPASRKNRKALIVAKVEARKAAKAEKHDAAEAIPVPNAPPNRPGLPRVSGGGDPQPRRQHPRACGDSGGRTGGALSPKRRLNEAAASDRESVPDEDGEKEYERRKVQSDGAQTRA